MVSPLLANNHLDALVRYADAVVILCHTAEEATNAVAEVQTWTAQAGLTLHPTKDRIVDYCLRCPTLSRRSPSGPLLEVSGSR